jgi:hypothetical protein
MLRAKEDVKTPEGNFSKYVLCSNNVGNGYQFLPVMAPA